MSLSSEEERPFLANDPTAASSEKGCDAQGADASHRCHYQRRYRCITLVILGFSLLFLLADIWMLTSLTQRGTKSTPYSPANHAVTHVLQNVHQYIDNDPFAGPPSAEFDQAWSSLLSPFLIHVTADEMQRAHQQSLRLQPSDHIPEDNYLGYLEVYHQLHCIKLMIQVRHPDHYPKLVANDYLSDIHFQHCIQSLRHAIMCQADISLNTWKWEPDSDSDVARAKLLNASEPLTTSSEYVASRATGKRQCTDWNRLDDWARSRSVGKGYSLAPPWEEGSFGPATD